MMKKLIKTLCVVTAAAALAGCASSANHARTFHCNLTGKDLAQCCCTKKDGKLYCNETQKFVDPCCCIIVEPKM